MQGRAGRLARIVAGLVLALVLLGVLGAQLGARRVEAHIVDLLGPLGHAEHIHVGWKQIVLEQVRIGAPPGWPAPQTLRARRLSFEPSWLELLSRRTRIERVVGEDVYLSVWRDAHGRLRTLPTLRQRGGDTPAPGERHAATPGASAPLGNARQAPSSEAATSETTVAAARRPTSIGEIVFQGGELDYYDSTVARPPHRIVLRDFAARIGPLDFPARATRSKVQLSGKPGGNGRLTLDGWVALATHDTDVRTRLANVQAPLLAPYLLKHAPGSLQGGRVDLDMHTRIAAQRLDAQGHLVLSDLHFADDGDTLLSLPRQAVLAALADKHGKITLDFTLNGNLRDPEFSINNSIAMRFATGVVKALGVNAEGVAGSLGETAKGLGGALMNLLGH